MIEALRMIKSLKFIKIQGLREAGTLGLAKNFPRGPGFGYIGKFAFWLIDNAWSWLIHRIAIVAKSLSTRQGDLFRSNIRRREGILKIDITVETQQLNRQREVNNCSVRTIWEPICIWNALLIHCSQMVLFGTYHSICCWVFLNCDLL